MPGPSRLVPARLVLLLIALAPIALAGLACARRSNENTLARIRRTGVLKIGTDATYPPFESVDPGTGQVVGFDVDVVRALAGRLGVKADFTVVPFDGIIPGLKAEKYDLVVSAMTITEERAKQVRFTRPYVVAGQSVAVRTGETAIRGVADLRGKRVGCQLGTTGELEAKKILEADVVSFDAIGAAFRDLENGNLDAAIADTPTARIFIRDHPTIRLAGEPLTREEFGMAMRMGDLELVSVVDRALDELRGGGEMQRIEEAWGVIGPGEREAGR
jgi:ABC-type amino acid transport substrate-binding protein